MIPSSAAFQRRLGPSGDSNAGACLGLEHEFVVALGGDRRDFRRIVHMLDVGPAGLDPADPNAYRQPSGAVITADLTEAEIALPPARLLPGFAARLVARADAAAVELRSKLPAEIALHGYSTHLSVSMTDALNAQVVRCYARTFAPALMLLLDRANSPGLLIRPRPGRTELGGEFAQGYALRAAAAFAAGSVRACAAAIAGDRRARAALPPELRVRIVPDTNRFGWYVDRRAFGPDLYSIGRATPLRLAHGGAISAQQQLERAWGAARDALADIAGPDDFSDADRMVAGRLPLPTEDPTRSIASPPCAIGTTAYASVLKPRRRPGYELAPVMVTWDTNVFLIVNDDRTRRAFACVPRHYAERFLILLLRGELDEAIAAYLRETPQGRRLHRHDQTFVPGLYDELGPRAGLLPIERPPQRPRLARLKRLLSAA